jgi:hypothetical protein
MNIEELMKNPKFKIDIPTFILEIKKETLMNKYVLNSILKRQVEILELQKGKTGQELENAVESELERIENQHAEWVDIDMVDFLSESSED